MARITSKKTISGLVGNVVFLERYGEQLMRSRPTKMKQTAATKKSASEFGQCSVWSKQLRQGLGPFLVNLTDSRMYQRFSGLCYNALLGNTTLPSGQRSLKDADAATFTGFEFNTHSPFVAYCQVPINAVLNAQRQVEVRIPTFNPASAIHFPEGATAVELWLYVYATNFDSNAPIVDGYHMIPIALTDAELAETVWTGPALPENYFVLVTAKLVYYEANRFTTRHNLNHKELNPAMVLLGSGTGG